MDLIERAYEYIIEHLQTDVGRFYGTVSHLNIGVGLIFGGIRYPWYNDERHIFQTRRGVVYVMTHECDVTDGNRRPFNDDVLICPIMKFEEFVKVYHCQYGEEKMISFLRNIAQRKVFRLMYFPPLPGELGYGGIMFLNMIANTKISSFSLEGAQRVGALSMFGLFEVDRMLERHLLRPKDQRLSFSIH